MMTKKEAVAAAAIAVVADLFLFLSMITYQVKQLLESHNVNYIVKEHEPTPTSQDSARARGEPLKIGAKALIVKAKQGFIMAVLPADKKLDTKKLKIILGSKNLRFATQEELKEVTGLPPGAVPPFSQFFNIPLLVDNSLFDEEYMAFNAGSLTVSIKMKTNDYQMIVKPQTADFSF